MNRPDKALDKPLCRGNILPDRDKPEERHVLVQTVDGRGHLLVVDVVHGRIVDGGNNGIIRWLFMVFSPPSTGQNGGGMAFQQHIKIPLLVFATHYGLPSFFRLTGNQIPGLAKETLFLRRLAV